MASTNAQDMRRIANLMESASISETDIRNLQASEITFNDESDYSLVIRTPETKMMYNEMMELDWFKDDELRFFDIHNYEIPDDRNFVAVININGNDIRTYYSVLDEISGRYNCRINDYKNDEFEILLRDQPPQ